MRIISRQIVALALVIAVYVVVARLTPSRELQETIRLVAFSCGFGFMMAFLGDFLRSMFRPYNELDVGDGYIIGLWLFSCGLTFFAFWSLLWRLSGYPLWMQNNDLVGFFLMFFVAALTIMLAMLGFRNGSIPPRSRARVALWWGVGALLTCYVITVRPDFSRVVEKLRPYFEEPASAPISIPPAPPVSVPPP